MSPLSVWFDDAWKTIGANPMAGPTGTFHDGIPIPDGYWERTQDAVNNYNPAQLADILEKAAEILERDEWIQGHLHLPVLRFVDDDEEEEGVKVR